MGSIAYFKVTKKPLRGISGFGIWVGALDSKPAPGIVSILCVNFVLLLCLQKHSRNNLALEMSLAVRPI